MNSSIFTTNNLELLESYSKDAESVASISLNPSFSWAKFILTDDQPNENKQRIPREEFSNLINTGVHAPIKMAVGGINPGHEESLPIGVITHLKDLGDKIEGIAALWGRERSDDITHLKEMYEKGIQPQLSWEVLYGESSKNEEGIEDLRDTVLRATTIVGMPAYAGRTPIIAMASKNETNSEEGLMEKEELEAKVAELETKLASFAELEAKLQEAISELETLREYKSSIEKEKADAEKLASIKTKFSEAGIEKDETFYTEKRDMLLGMDANALEFMIQELVAFASNKQTKTSEASQIPNMLSGTDDLSSDPVALAKYLRERNKTK